MEILKEISYVITDAIGLHARPAGLLVKAASKFSCDIKIKKGAMESDAKGIIAVMSLGVKNGEEITLSFNGTDEAEASESIRTFLLENL
jgi:phosphocarrier protein